MNPELFAPVGIRESEPSAPRQKAKWYAGKPMVSMILLVLILLSCLLCELYIPHDPTYMDLQNHTKAPGGAFWFGTDTMGRDIFSMIWYGGRISLFIGFASTLIATLVAILYGTISGLSTDRWDRFMMRFADILLSVPSLLLVLFIQAIFGEANVLSISVVIGITSWVSIAKVIRTEVRQLRNSEYILAAKCMGGSYFHILWRHLTPNFVSAILFMVVMNLRSAIIAESTLSFIGMGLPLEIISWGSMLSLAQRAMLSGAWWMILIPGAFLVVTLLCIANVGNYLREAMNQKERNL